MKRFYYSKRKRSGIALIASLIFIAVFMALAVGMVTMSSGNTLAAVNLKTGNLARSTAESGLETVRYWMRLLPTTLSANTLYDETLDNFEVVLTNANAPYVRDGKTLHIGPVLLEQATGRTFEAWVTEPATEDVDMTVTVKGQTGQLSRTLQVGYKAHQQQLTSSTPNPYNWFDFGVASKGPLSLKSLEITAIDTIDGVDVKVNADAYIESAATNDALAISNAKISGDVQIVNPDALVTMSGGQSSIGGEAGQSAIDNHVRVGVQPVEFPVPNPGHFDQYVTGITIDSSNKGLYSNNATLENVRIAAGTNPRFTGNVVVRGVLYIEQPNVVEFGGNADITGVIIGNGSLTDNSQTNQINFTGTVNSTNVTQLPNETKFTDIRNETGTFLMAPGFGVSFGGNFGTLNGCIIANGVKTYGNAGGTIAGSILNFNDQQPMQLEGKDLLFRKSGVANIPPHLKTESSTTTITYWSFQYEPTAYEEVLNTGF